MYWGQEREQWNKLCLSIVSLSHATANSILPLTEIMDLGAKLNWKFRQEKVKISDKE